MIPVRNPSPFSHFPNLLNDPCSLKLSFHTVLSIMIKGMKRKKSLQLTICIKILYLERSKASIKIIRCVRLQLNFSNLNILVNSKVSWFHAKF